MREFVKKLLPRSIFNIVRPIFQCWYVLYAYLYDYVRYLKYSSSLGYSSAAKLESIIVMNYHVVEKGLTMPKTRLGFGKDRIPRLCDFCDKYILNYDLSSSNQVQHAVGVLKEYLDFHDKRGFSVQQELKTRILRTVNLAESKLKINPTKQIDITREEYFKFGTGHFPDFASSRKSIRNYSSENIPDDTMRLVFRTAQTSPSACNRQTARVHVFSDKEKIKEILDIQGGSGGFGYLANKLIVITAELGAFGGAHERYQAYIDGGMFAMNVLYALHAYSIGCCILNCSNAPYKDKKLQKVCNINKNEVFIAMISCGFVPEQFSIATSQRYELEEIYTIW